jgi:hypothetical protein
MSVLFCNQANCGLKLCHYYLIVSYAGANPSSCCDALFDVVCMCTAPICRNDGRHANNKH